MNNWISILGAVDIVAGLPYLSLTKFPLINSLIDNNFINKLTKVNILSLNKIVK